MKFVFLAFLLSFSMAIPQEEPSEYPEGVFCSPAGITARGKVIDADHPCFCKNMASSEDSCEKPTTNDPECKQWCHEKHCSCPMLCTGSIRR